MYSNDLLSYSIMHSGRKAVMPAPTSMHSMPLSNLPGVGPIQKKEAIVLPPLHNYARFSEQAHKHNLTENNLLRFGRIGNTKDSPTPSLTSASSIEISSPEQSPRMAHSTTQSSSEYSESVSTADAANLIQKRRQRQGPSCESCRSRKVKCDADIVVLSRNNAESLKVLSNYGNPQECLAQLSVDGASIQLPEKGSSIISSNDKLIKFTSCKSCNNKGMNCKFPKGYTKEDIMLNSKKSNASSVDPSAKSNSYLSNNSSKSGSMNKSTSKIAKITKKIPGHPSATSSRKSSCVSCRRRKVKCVYNSALKKCECCHKKSQSCNFEDLNNNADVGSKLNGILNQKIN